MKIAAIFLALFIFASAESYAPRAHPVIPSLALTDGRTLKDAKILSDTALAVSVFCAGKILSIDKNLLPPDILAQWPIDEARAAKDRAADQAVIDAREAHIAKNRAAAEEAKQAHIKDAMAAADRSKASDDAREATRAVQHESLVASRGGILIRGAASSYGIILVLAENVSAGDVDFDWRSIRYSTANSVNDAEFNTVIFVDGAVQDYIVRAHTQRVFALRQVPVLEVSSLRWSDRPEIYPVKQLYRHGSAWDVRDHRIDAKGPARGILPTDDEPTKLLVQASWLYVDDPRRK